MNKINNNSQDMISDNWPDPILFKKSIRLEFSVYVSVVIIALMLITGYVVTHEYVNTVTKNIIGTLLVQTRSYSNPAGKFLISSETPDALMLGNICNKLSSDNPEIFWAGITDKRNRYVAHTDLKKIVNNELMEAIATNSYTEMLLQNEAAEIRGDTLYISIPIVDNDILLGSLIVASSLNQVILARSKSITTMAIITAIMILLGVPFTTIMLSKKLKPISTITDQLKNISFEDIKIDIPISSKNELGYLAKTLMIMGKKLNRAQKELLENERIERELEIAREIQENILPREYPGDSNFEFGGAYRSAKQIGGDYYDFIDFDDRQMAFVIADVSGKSLPGMLVMLLTRDIIKEQSRLIREPVVLLSKVNEELGKNIKKGMFVTMFYGLIDKFTGDFEFASAGHNPLIRFNSESDELEEIKTKGFPLGMMKPAQFDRRIEKHHFKLTDGDWLIQYSDGINEAQNLDQEEFGMARFTRQLQECKQLKPQGLVDKTLTKHQEFVGSASQYDDITLVAMKWNQKSADIENNKGREISVAGK